MAARRPDYSAILVAMEVATEIRRAVCLAGQVDFQMAGQADGLAAVGLAFMSRQVAAWFPVASRRRSCDESRPSLFRAVLPLLTLAVLVPC